MYTSISFSPIIKYIIISIITYMFVNSVKISSEQILQLVSFVLFISVITDMFMFDDYITILQQNQQLFYDE